VTEPAGTGGFTFARFAYPPNELGYCGPDADRELLERVAAGGRDDGGLRHLARGFAGAWPYLELIAGANGIADPLDARVVEAYWVGSPLLARVRPSELGASLDQRFRPRAGSAWSGLADAVELAARPHHNFHVFSVYPWVGLLRGGSSPVALDVLDRCRVRWARVLAVGPEGASVASRRLTWDGTRLGLSAPQPETVATATDGLALLDGLAPGDVVACHWGWASQRLSARQARWLRHETRAQLGLVNRDLATAAMADRLDPGVAGGGGAP
jgi:hypothetical protein